MARAPKPPATEPIEHPEVPVDLTEAAEEPAFDGDGPDPFAPPTESNNVLDEPEVVTVPAFNSSAPEAGQFVAYGAEHIATGECGEWVVDPATGLVVGPA